MFGLALLYAKQGGISSAFSQVIALIILSQVLIVLAGYAYGVATYYYPVPFTDMSIYGALCAALPVVTYVPALSRWLPHLLAR